MDSQEMILVENLVKSFSTHKVVDRISFSVHSGETLGLLGPNGAGKTTTVEILQGLRRRDAGTVSVLGADPAASSPAWRARLGVVSQSSTDLGELSVKEAVTHVSHFYARPADVAETIARVGLTDDARTRTSRLSGGRRRRLDVALAIVGRPELLFLDEPTTGFDPEARSLEDTRSRENERTFRNFKTLEKRTPFRVRDDNRHDPFLPAGKGGFLRDALGTGHGQ